MRFVKIMAYILHSTRHDKPKNAMRALKYIRRAMRGEICRLKRGGKCRTCRQARMKDDPPAATETRRVRVLSARPGGMETSLPPSGFSFRPPNPAVVRQIMADGVPLAPDGIAPRAPDMDDDDLLILPPEPPPTPEPAPALVALPPPAGFVPAQAEDDLPTS